MGDFRAVAALLGVVVVGVCAVGCSTSEAVMDLGRNERLYRSIGYRSQVPADRSALLLPVVDDREVRVEEAAGAFTVEYFSDGRWSRSPAQMVDAVLRDELTDSGVFRELATVAALDGCVLRVRLTRFDVGTETHVAGIRSFAAVTLAVEVLGPAGAGGVRPTWLEQEFVGAHRSEIDWRPVPAASLMGASLRDAMAQLLARLDQSNVGRSGVPLDVQSP